MRTTHQSDYKNAPKGTGNQPTHYSFSPSVICERSGLSSCASSLYRDNPYLQSFHMNNNLKDCHSTPVVRRRHVSPTSHDTSHYRKSVNFAARPSECPKKSLSNDDSCRVKENLNEIYQMLFQERTLRQAAERRTLEESEKGARASIVVEAVYGARLLYSVFIETLASLPPVENLSLSPRRIVRRPPQKSPAFDNDDEDFQSPFTVHDKQLLSNINLCGSAMDYNHLLEENTRLREEVERYRNIDLEDRKDINELHKNLQMALKQCELERDELYYELRGYWPVSAVYRTCELGDVCGVTTKKEEGKGYSHLKKKENESDSLWHNTHFVDPSATNIEESPELPFRRCVLPRSSSRIN